MFFGRNEAKAETPVLGHLMRRVDSLEKTLMLGGIGGRRRRGGQRERWHYQLNGHQFKQAPAVGDCSHEIKRRLLLGKKVMTNLNSILKNRDITLPAKVHQVKSMVFQWSRTDVRVGL